MTKIRINRKFGSRILNLTWRDIKFSVDKGWLDLGVVVDFAVQQLEATDSQIISELAFLDFSESQAIREKLELLNISTTSDTLEPKWLKITTAWIFEHRNDFEDPIVELSDHFNDFENAEEIRHLTFYGKLEGYPRDLIADWKSYLEAQVYSQVLKHP